MPHTDKKADPAATNEGLSTQKNELITLMGPIVQEYYQSENLSKEKVEQAVAANINELNALMGKILATITIQETEAQFELLDEADKASAAGTGFY